MILFLNEPNLNEHIPFKRTLPLSSKSQTNTNNIYIESQATVAWWLGITTILNDEVRNNNACNEMSNLSPD